MYIIPFVGQVESDCPTKKFGYDNKSEALAAITRIKKRKQFDLVAYQCCCKKWNLTTSRKAKKGRSQ